MKNLGVLFDTQASWLTEQGFIKYFDENGNVGPVRSLIQPPANAGDIFVGCGRDTDNIIQLGAIGAKDVFFEEKHYTHGQPVSATPNNGFYSYYNQDTNSAYNVFGFSLGL